MRKQYLLGIYAGIFSFVVGLGCILALLITDHFTLTGGLPIISFVAIDVWTVNYLRGKLRQVGSGK